MNKELENYRQPTVKSHLKGPCPDFWVPDFTPLNWKTAKLTAQDTTFHQSLQDPSSVFSRKTWIFLGLLEPG